jgi:imidazolonepropionase-like amidohydrolase
MILLALAALPCAFSNGALSAQESASTTIFADKVYLAPGKVVENGILHFSGEKLAAIEGRVPSSNEQGVHVKAVTAGMIDASVRITNGLASVEQMTEIQPDRRVADSLDPFDPRWKRVLSSGITTALVTAEGYDVIGGLGIVLKTGGADSIAGRTVKADAVVSGAIGSMPSAFNSPAGGPPEDFYARRPTTRMGVEWEWRKALYDAAASTRLPERAFPGSEVLVRALRGEIPVCIEAWTTQDIRTAVFLDEEMGREKLGDLRLIVDCAAEAWKEPQLLVRSGAAVILPPFESGGRTGPERPGAFLAWNVAKELQDMGVLVALSSHGAANVSDRLALQAAYAMRGGMTFDEALAAVTVNPARMLGVEDRVGSIGTGMDADLVLWNGTPFEPTSRIVGVVLNGKLVVDPRK